MSFINLAYAAEATAFSSILASNLVPMALICVVFYILIIRPHKTKMKKHADMLSALVTGDRVMTSGGILGIVYSVSPTQEEITIEIAKNVRVAVAKSAISEVVNKNSVETVTVKNH